ncbi:hypothetical protein [Leifsonia aquatica]|uniref:hypothetical protein n=1 Tax=Leifsonia aquatica TaxID=144185 RepID=UPI003819167D
MGEHRPLSVAGVAVAVGLAAGALALALTGCVPAPSTPGFVEGTPGSSGPGSVSTSPAPSADAEGAVADPAQPSTWTIGFDAVGPLVLGTPSSEQHEVLAAFEPEVAGDGCGLDFVSTPTGLRVGTGESAADGVTSIVLNAEVPAEAGAGPRTANGIGIGSTIDDLVAAYPDARKTSDMGEGLITYAVTDASGRSIVFGAWRTDPAIATIQVGTGDRITAEGCGITA